MEGIDSFLFNPSTVFNGDASSNYFGQYTPIHPPNMAITISSSHSSSPLQISDGKTIDYKTPKVNCCYKYCQTGKNAGIIIKKGIHKFVERKRRKDMKTLYSVLRSLLPEEYIMGKPSTAEQLLETSNYIMQLQQTVKELTQRKEERREQKMWEDLTFSVASETFPTVKVNCLGSGVLISTSTINYQFVLSDLLLTLENKGFDIASVASSAISDKVFHSIHAKVPDLQRFDGRTLYQMVWKFINEKTSNAEAEKC